jgi:hypothetical protein
MSARAFGVLLFLPLLAAAASEGACPKPPAAAAILPRASGSCPAADSPGLWVHHVGVVEVSATCGSAA